MDRWINRTAKLLRVVNAMEATDRNWLKIGKGVRIAENVCFTQPMSTNTKTSIGNNVEIDFGTVIGEGVRIADKARISSNVRIENNCDVGENTFIGHCTILRPNTEIRANCTIGHLCVFEGYTVVGDGTLIHSQCHITKGVEIGRQVFIAPMFVGANDPMMCHARRHLINYEERPYKVEDGVRIAVGVSLLPGIVLGHDCMVGAHALVTKNVSPNMIVRGVPAVVVGEVSERERICRFSNS